jgi:acyl-[acyl carrier protein]--UDP-N-acetylglucosamine O-acyltransferase
VPPFSAVRDRSLKGYNAIGCRRAGLSPRSLVSIRAAYRKFRHHRNVSDALIAVRAEVPDCEEVREILEFISLSKRGIVPWMRSLRSRHIASTDETDE